MHPPGGIGQPHRPALDRADQSDRPRPARQNSAPAANPCPRAPCKPCAEWRAGSKARSSKCLDQRGIDVIEGNEVGNEWSSGAARIRGTGGVQLKGVKLRISPLAVPRPIASGCGIMARQAGNSSSAWTRPDAGRWQGRWSLRRCRLDTAKIAGLDDSKRLIGQSCAPYLKYRSKPNAAGRWA